MRIRSVKRSKKSTGGKKMKKGLLFVGALLASLMVLTSCNGGGSGGEIDLVGFWIDVTNEPVSWPGTSVLEFRADGNYYEWEDYRGTILRESGTWSPHGSAVIWSGGTVDFTVIDDNTWSFTWEEQLHIMKRKGTEPSIFDSTPTELTEGVWEDGSISEEDELYLYSFTAGVSTDYDIGWQDSSTGVLYTGRISVYACDTDHVPLYSLDRDLHTNPETVALVVGQMIYIIVEGRDPGTYSVRVIEPS
jgi:hypothetical protein